MSVRRVSMQRIVLSLLVQLAALGCAAGGPGVVARAKAASLPLAAELAAQPACTAAPSPGKPALCIPKGGAEQFVVGLPEEHGWERGDWVTVNVAQPGMTNALPIALAVVAEPYRDVARVSVLYQRGERGLDGGRVRRVGKGERARLGKFVGSIVRVEGGQVRLDVGAKDDARADDIYEIRSAQDSSLPIARVRVTELGDLHLWAAPLDHLELLREGLIAVYLGGHESSHGEQRQGSIVVANFTPTNEQDAEEVKAAQGYSRELANALTNAAAGVQGVSVRYEGNERVLPAGSDAEAHAEARSLGKRHAADIVVWGSMRCRESSCALPRVTVVDPDRRQRRSDEDGGDAAGVTLDGAAPTSTLGLAAAILGSAAFDARRYADASYYLNRAVSEKILGTEDELRTRRDLSYALFQRGQTAAARTQANALLKRARELGEEGWEQLGYRAVARIDEQEGHVASSNAGGFVPPPSATSASPRDAIASAQDVPSETLHAAHAVHVPAIAVLDAKDHGPLMGTGVPPRLREPAASPKPTAPPVPDPAAEAKVVVRPDVAPERPWQRPAALVAMGIGVAGIGVGAVLGGLAIEKNGESNDTHCDAADRCDAVGVALRHEAMGLGDASTVAMIAGGVLLGGGAALFLLAPSSPTTPDRTGAKTGRWSAKLEVLPGGVQVRGAWR